MNNQQMPCEVMSYLALALDPIHVGTGGYRLGRVDLGIVREPGTNLPKIPGTSLSGACRTYAAMQVEGKYPHCAGQGQAGGDENSENPERAYRGHCGEPDCPICVTFGFAKGDSALQGLAQFTDAQLVLFPVHSLAGPMWVTCPDALRHVEGGEREEPPEGAVRVAEGLHVTDKLNLGWLMLHKDATPFSLALPEIETLSGEPAHEILDFTEREGGDLIVVCKHGARGGAGRIVLGSTSFRVIHSARVPVLVVHGPEGDEQAPDMVLPRYDRITTGTDFSDISSVALKVVLPFARRLNAKMNLLHVLRTPVFLPALPGEPPLYVPRETVSELHSKHAERLSKLVDELETARVDYTVTVGEDVAETIVAKAIEGGDKLIVIPSHGHGALRVTLFGSTSKHVVKLSPLPVLVLPRDFLESVAEEE